MQTVRVFHKKSNALIAEGEVGNGITAFEGNLYIRRKLMKGGTLKPNFIPGFCTYKFFYVGMHFVLDSGEKIKKLGWMYWLPNPLFPVLWDRIGIPLVHDELTIELIED